MMNKQIRRMIDEIFADMKMTADNLALRDELMANAQARFEDSVRAGKTEEEAFAEVAASLGDVQSLLREMNAEKPEDSAEETAQTETQTQSDETAEGEEAGADEPDFEVKTEKTPDIGEVLGKAFGALGDVGKQIVPQAQKLVRQVDDLTGGVIGGIGKAVGKGLSDAQKAAGKAIDKLSGDKGEIVIDFGKEKPKAPAALRERAKTIRAEAELKQAAGDQEGARELRAKAYALETEADDVEKKLAELAEKVYKAWKECTPNRARGVRITVSTSWFVPKPHTAFQWEAQVSMEEYRRRVKLLRDNMRGRSIRYNWHDPDTSFLEAVFSRGDRQVADVIEEAWRQGAKFDAWSEYFDFDRWMAAFDACGLDPAFYANRVREKDEVLPWSVTSTGVTTPFLWRERERAYQAVITPDCRVQCTGCGADKLYPGGKCDAEA